MSSQHIISQDSVRLIVAMPNFLWLLLLVFLPVAAATGGINGDASTLLTVVAALLLVTDSRDRSNDIAGHNTLHVKRTRKFVHQMFRESGPIHQQRAHRMNEESLWRLHRMLRPHMGGGRKEKDGQ